MDNEIFFSERQYFKQIWIWAILLVINGFIFFAFLKQVIGGHSYGDNTMSNKMLLIVMAFTILLSLLFFNLRLDTEIKSDGIYVRFYPFSRAYKKYSWSEITQSFVRQYNPISEFGGWGLRWGSNGKAYNVSGNKGIQLVLTGNKRLLIGTNKAEEVSEVLKQTGHLIITQAQ